MKSQRHVRFEPSAQREKLMMQFFLATFCSVSTMEIPENSPSLVGKLDIKRSRSFPRTPPHKNIYPYMCALKLCATRTMFYLNRVDFSRFFHSSAFISRIGNLRKCVALKNI